MKELIKEVERLKETKRKNRGGTVYNYCRIKLQGIKAAIKAVDNHNLPQDKDWIKLKRLLEL